MAESADSADVEQLQREVEALKRQNEELAQREQTGAKPTDSGRWQIDRSSSRQSAFGVTNNGHQP